MKNISVYLNIVLFIAVALLYIDRFSGNKSETNQASNSSSVSGDIVYVNMDSLLNGYDLYNELKTQLIQEENDLNANLNSRSKAYQRKAMEFQQKVDKQLVTSSQAKQMQDQLMSEQQNLLQLKDQLEGQFMEKQQNMNKQIFDRISEFMKKFNKVKGHKIIIGNAGTLILEADSNLDITEVVLKGLNEAYQKGEKIDLSSKTEDKK